MAHSRGDAGRSEAGGIAHVGGSHQVEGVAAVQPRFATPNLQPRTAAPQRAMRSRSLPVIDTCFPTVQFEAAIADLPALDICAADGTMCPGPILLPA